MGRRATPRIGVKLQPVGLGEPWAPCQQCQRSDQRDHRDEDPRQSSPLSKAAAIVVGAVEDAELSGTVGVFAQLTC